MTSLETTTRTLNPSTLIKLIFSIEKTYPGWWYSVSQQECGVTVSLGPSRASPVPQYRFASTQKIGDKGYIKTFEWHDAFDADMVMATIHKDYAKILLDLNNKGIVIRTEGFVRRQKPADLNKLEALYTTFLTVRESLESDLKLKFTEVYVGTCSFSADASLRGHHTDRKYDFDYSCDLKDTGTLAESFADCLDQVMNQ